VSKSDSILCADTIRHHALEFRRHPTLDFRPVTHLEKTGELMRPSDAITVVCSQDE
jgi:hypothetical protein